MAGKHLQQLSNAYLLLFIDTDTECKEALSQTSANN